VLPSRFRTVDEVTFVPIGQENYDKSSRLVGVIDDRKHFLVDFFRFSYIWGVFKRAPWYIYLYSILLLVVDLVLRNHFLNFTRLFIRHAVNKAGLVGQYIDMLVYSQASICSGEMSFFESIACHCNVNFSLSPCSVNDAVYCKFALICCIS